MQTLLLYDISHDGTRQKVADACLDYGLERIQYSAFSGDLSKNLQEQLLYKIRQRMGRHGGSIYLIPICAADWARRMEIDKPELP
jgi:CRISPR-associated protein Cas2